MVFKPLVALLGKLPVTGQGAIHDRLGNVEQLFADHERFTEWDLLITHVTHSNLQAARLRQNLPATNTHRSVRR
ncbi:hypothetical protein D3C85_1832910 [compost metagenome]